MSRLQVKGKDPNHRVIVGLDHITGYFIHVHDIKDPAAEAPFVWEETPRNYRMCELMREYCDLEDPATAKAFTNVRGDYDPVYKPGDPTPELIVTSLTTEDLIEIAKGR